MFASWKIGGQIRLQDNKNNGICCSPAKHAALRTKSKDWLVQNQDNVSELSKICICGLQFQWINTIKDQLLCTNQTSSSHHSKLCTIWKIDHLALSLNKINFGICRMKQCFIIWLFFFQLGTHFRGKKKREEMQAVLQKMRKAQQQHKWSVNKKKNIEEFVWYDSSWHMKCWYLCSGLLCHVPWYFRLEYMKYLIK